MFDTKTHYPYMRKTHKIYLKLNRTWLMNIGQHIEKQE